MLYRLMADILVVLHFAFIAFVVFGGFLVLWRRCLAMVHLPAAAWGVWIEFRQGVCPLTPLENQFRALAGEKGYAGGFIEHYLIPTIYPTGLTKELQIVLGSFVIIVNVGIYAWVMARAWNESSCESGTRHRERGPREK